MATLPFLQAIGESTGWYTYTDLMNMLAVSESTPGPIGINMATYVGFTVAGDTGRGDCHAGRGHALHHRDLIVAAILKSFRDNKYVDRAFYGLRPASTGLIGAACVAVILEVLTNIQSLAPAEGSLLKGFALGDGSFFRWQALLLAAALLVLTNWVKPTKNLHPIVFIGLSAVAGVVFQFASL